MATSDNQLDREALWNAIKFQESRGQQFDSAGNPITSSAGAVGIAQLMPATAKSVAAQHGIPWDAVRLQSDQAYNEQIGKAFFNDLADKYKDNMPKILAAYNAGETAVDSAVKSHGDNWRSHLVTDKNYIGRITANYMARTDTVLGGNPEDRPIAGPSAAQSAAPNPANIAGPPAPQEEAVSPPVAAATSPQVAGSAAHALAQAATIYGSPAPGENQSKNLNAPLTTDKSGVPIVFPQTAGYAEAKGELGANIKPSYWDKFWSQSELGLLDMPTAVGQRQLDIANANLSSAMANTAKLSPDEANRQFPGLPKPFTEPVYPSQAQIIFDAHQRRERLQAWVDRGPDTGALFNLGAGMVGGADPIALALGSVMGMGVRAAGLGAGFGPNAVARIASKLGITYTDQFAANLASMLPGYLQRGADHEAPMTASEVVGGAAGGAAIGTGLHLAIDALLSEGKRSVGRLSAAKIRQNLEAALAQHEAGTPVDMTPAVVEQIARESGAVSPGIENPYQFQVLDHPADVHYYTATDPETGHFAVGDPVHGGIVGVDNKAVANNVAGAPETTGSGKIIRSELSRDAKLIRGDASIRDLFPEGTPRNEALGHIQEILGLDDRKWAEYADTLKNLWKNQATIQDLYQYLESATHDKIRPYNEQPLSLFQQLLDGRGYDGMAFHGMLGDTPIDNRVMVFNHDMLKPVEITEPDRGAVPTIPPDTAQAINDQMHSPENDRAYNPEADQKYRESVASVPKEIDLSKLDDSVKQDEEQARQHLESIAKESGNPEIVKEVSLIDEERKMDQYKIEAVKNLMQCLTDTTI